MNITGNTILITGGGSGIGRALAEAFLKRGNDVIVTGRNRDKLIEVESANPGIHTYQLDVDDPDPISAFSGQVVTDFPTLNVLINNAGIMHPETVQEGSTATAEATIATNLLGPIRFTTALLPHLVSKPDAAVLTVSSSLAFMPRAAFPTYCATKAATARLWSPSVSRRAFSASIPTGAKSRSSRGSRHDFSAEGGLLGLAVSPNLRRIGPSLPMRPSSDGTSGTNSTS